ncbi:MAG: hypothetical protein ACTTH4_03850 [Prevotella denticola]|uniref:hypothetical protein n=1 Tax=Prevotella denticola TaxID=28129 RepID=UPI003F9FA226
MKKISQLLLVGLLLPAVVQAQTSAIGRRQAVCRSMERQGLVNVKRAVPSVKVALILARYPPYNEMRMEYACLASLWTKNKTKTKVKEEEIRQKSGRRKDETKR